LEIVQRVHQNYGFPVASHLTCVGATTDQLRDFLREAARRQIDNIVALRGDPPRGETEFRPVAGGLQYANQLVELIRREFPGFGIAVAGYPETHQEAADARTDLQNLKRKVDAGADAVITQLFYDNRDFFRFRDACDDLGIAVPIVPGILPVTNFAQIQRITSLCGALLPDEFLSGLKACGEDEARQFDVGVEFASRQVQELRESGVPGIHFYVLNKSQATASVLHNVGL
jgi:methylenetetrahydrofolate reductase (NADPH)